MRNKPKGMQFFFLIKLNGGGGGRGQGVSKIQPQTPIVMHIVNITSRFSVLVIIQVFIQYASY